MFVKFGHPTAKRKQLVDSFFNQDFDKLFKGFENALNLPLTNIKEGEDAYTIELSVPGFQKSDFNLKLDNDLLTISTKVEGKKEETKEKYTRREFKNRSFSRTFTLPEMIVVDDINAKYDSGILSVTLPKNKEVLASKHKEITVS